jgi:predicted dehydrogenase
MSGPVKVGVIGCGVISDIYFTVARSLAGIEIVACADIQAQAAAAKGAQHGIERVYSVAELLADPEIEIALNLTTPEAHYPVALAALNAGKSVYNEKPLALTRQEGQALLALAETEGLLLGCAPDTFMGGGQQTVRQVIDDGVIGTPVAATAFVLGPGHERWHPNPEFFYKAGGGPMFDMGPYYLTALVNLLGPVRRVTGMVGTPRQQRTITSKPRYGQVIDVEVPTHVAGTMEFAGGAIGTIVTSFDVEGSDLPHIEIYGTKGTLKVPDPNTFGGPVQVLLDRKAGWQDVPLTHGYTENSRGIGLADMADGLRSGRPHRANGRLAYHVLDLMHAFHDAAESGRHVTIKSTCDRPVVGEA